MLSGPVTYRGSEADAREFLESVQARVATAAVKVQWLRGSAVWLSADGSEVARVTADRPILIDLVRTWARAASAKGQLEINIADRD